MSTWLITGATSGFGRLVADRVIASGNQVIAIGRRRDRLDDLVASAPEGRVTAIVLDLTDPGAEKTVGDAVRAAGGLDVVVNNAGYGLFGSVEQTSADEAKANFDTNVSANLAVLRATLPAIRASKGRIVQLSSLVGSFAWPASGLYSASKAAVELFSEALALELAPTGAKVTVIQPGMFATEFTTSAHVVPPSEPYLPTVGAFLEQVSQIPADTMGDPNAVADAILAVATMDEPPLRLAVGQDAIDAIRNALQTRLSELDQWAATDLTPAV
ncbi:NAD(P)-dependent dehydrogenase (short-subunit alcohol dehydrogenase family) [Streptomyces umbrinus]|uniref:SDR family oxidoreductase n=1 Tax=Streptomyces phaeochromogenes group TaxID=2838332 RepID=UPI00167D7B63|nr:SDR family oxidoreductase [Streptomyces umbrinus]MCR3731919.1 NAD(P)-dependent dehydrogenase (short-subunit alcohol dehydrogenase family) [Streptomyces umbrinus]WTA00935.1 SDR family oxidoreductase [Streptomyces phaeochromogenes]GHH66450.1 short-chain dehydrogenase/reductase [Streptomyces umbrinus]